MYVFAIGGSGSRVLKSLTMLLAAGVTCGVDTIVPIIVDKDVTCFKNTKDLIDSYIKTQEYVPDSASNAKIKNKFFHTKFQLLNGSLVLQLDDKKDIFKDYINYSVPGELGNTKSLVDVLFSKKTLEMSTSVGFQGNPNVGSVVLNQFNEQAIFKTFGEQINAEDKIFIISSIFGGTGASGFPILLKTLNHPVGVTVPNNIIKAQKGAVTILPYFKVSSQKDDNNKDSLVPETFIPGTKAALHYYCQTLDKQLDTLYYIGEPSGFRATYKHEKGGSRQEDEDKAHIVELVAALSIIDFANSKPRNTDGTIYKEFGIDTKSDNDDGSVVNFDNLPEETRNLIKKPFLQLLLTHKFINEQFKADTEQPYLEKLGISEDFFKKNDSMKSFLDVLQKYYIYLQEIEDNKDKLEKRIFAPFSLETQNPFTILKNQTIKQGFLRKNSWAWFIGKLNAEVDNVISDITDTAGQRLTEKRIVELLYRASEKFFDEKI